MLYKTNFKILKVIIGAMLLVFLLQSCNYPYYPLPTCSHPWLVVGFDAESIGTTTGDLEITMYADWEEYIWGVQIGHEFFDKIAREYKFWDMKQMYGTNEIENWLLTEYGVYPMNVFLVTVTYSVFEAATVALKENENILYINNIRCSKPNCSDYLDHFKTIGGQQ